MTVLFSSVHLHYLHPKSIQDPLPTSAKVQEAETASSWGLFEELAEDTQVKAPPQGMQ